MRGATVFTVLIPPVRVWVLCGLVIGSAGARAQYVLPPPPAVPVVPPALQDFQDRQWGEKATAEESVLSTLAALPFQWGPVILHPHFLYSLQYADGVLFTPGQSTTTLEQIISPGITFTLGKHWALDYTPSLVMYSDQHFSQALNHSVRLSGWTEYEAWHFGLVQSYAATLAPIVQTGTETDQQLFNTALSASRSLSSYMSMDLGINLDVLSASQFDGYRSVYSMDWLNYRLTPRVSLGLGLGGGYVNVDTGSDMVYEQFQGRVVWIAGYKTTVSVNGGLEDRQFLQGKTGDLFTPVYGLSVAYQARQATTLTLSVARSVSASYFADQVSDTTSISASVGQRLLKKLNLGMGAEYDMASYSATSVGANALHGYDYYSFNVRLSALVLKRGSVSATYRYSRNSSGLSSLSFNSSQVGFELGYSW